MQLLIQTMPITRDRMNQEDLLNRNPLNQACLKVLPPDWRSPPGLHCLGLLWWGLDNLRLEPRQNGLPLDEDVEAQAVELEAGNPAWALNGKGWSTAPQHRAGAVDAAQKHKPHFPRTPKQFRDCIQRHTQFRSKTATNRDNYLLRARRIRS